MKHAVALFPETFSGRSSLSVPIFYRSYTVDIKFSTIDKRININERIKMFGNLCCCMILSASAFPE
jgi:hypothetical protein